MSIVLDIFVWPVVALFALYVIGIQYQRGGWWRIVAPITLAGLLLDVVLNQTLLALYLWDRPQAGETTFTKHLNRLTSTVGWRGRIARAVCKALNFFAPGGCHCKPFQGT